MSLLPPLVSAVGAVALGIGLLVGTAVMEDEGGGAGNNQETRQGNNGKSLSMIISPDAYSARRRPTN